MWLPILCRGESDVVVLLHYLCFVERQIENKSRKEMKGKGAKEREKNWPANPHEKRQRADGRRARSKRRRIFVVSIKIHVSTMLLFSTIFVILAVRSIRHLE